MDCQQLNEIEGLKFMPITKGKRPILKNWQISTDVHDLSNCYGVGLVCGKLSGNLEVIDIDCKYDLTKMLFESYKRMIHEADPTLLSKLVVQATMNGGFHLIYRCSEIGGNVKLANRPTTEEERNLTFQEEYAKFIADPKVKNEQEAQNKANRARQNDKVRVLIETRGEGGYIACFPSNGYKIIYGDFYSIQEITIEQRNILLSTAMEYNQVYEEYKPALPKEIVKMKGLSPFEDYNERGDVIGLLESNGWRVVKQKGSKTLFLRPGQTSSDTSGNYDSVRKWFSVFSTSTEFEAQKAYLPYAVFAYLECDKDFVLASKKLYDMGYGDRHEPTKKESTRVIESRINVDDGDYSFLATAEDYNPYLEQVIDGTLPMGLTTGSKELDAHFLFKKGNFVNINGVDNVGKSVFMWWLMLLAAMYHGWKGLIFSSENTLGNFMRKMIQFFWGKQLTGQYAMSNSEYVFAKKFIEKHFLLIKAQEDLYNYKDIVNMVKKAKMKYPNIDYAMIDPYNSLKINLSGFSKLSTHEYHYEALSEMKSYGQKNDFGWFINHHAYTGAARQKDGEKKYPAAPNKADTEGGQKVANKADDFLTIHRITQHPTDWMVTEVHVRKIKDTETGGKPTPLDSPVKFEMYKGETAFRERLDGFGAGDDPIEKWHKLRNENQQQKLDLPTAESKTWYDEFVDENGDFF